MMTPYDVIANVIDTWCQEHYYGHFLVTLSIEGELCVEYLYFETEDLKWVWENDWWEGQKDIKLIGFIDIDSVRVSGTPDNYKILEMEVISAEDCKCYRAEKNFLGKIGQCWGTQERDACSCGGDKSKCDFYPSVREEGKKPICLAWTATGGGMNMSEVAREMTYDEQIANFIMHILAIETPFSVKRDLISDLLSLTYRYERDVRDALYTPTPSCTIKPPKEDERRRINTNDNTV